MMSEIKLGGTASSFVPLLTYPSHRTHSYERMRIACSPCYSFGMAKLFITWQSSLLESQIQSMTGYIKPFTDIV